MKKSQRQNFLGKLHYKNKCKNYKNDITIKTIKIKFRFSKNVIFLGVDKNYVANK